MPSGFFGKVLWIDLTKESFMVQDLPEKLYRSFIGGYGLGCKLIYENTKPKLEIFDPNAELKPTTSAATASWTGLLRSTRPRRSSLKMPGKSFLGFISASATLNVTS